MHYTVLTPHFLESSTQVFCCCSVAKLFLFLWSHRLQHARLLCPPLSPRVCSDSCPLSQWCYNHLILCHPLLLTSIFPSIRVFSMSWLLASSGQIIGASASASVHTGMLLLWKKAFPFLLCFLIVSFLFFFSHSNLTEVCYKEWIGNPTHFEIAIQFFSIINWIIHISLLILNTTLVIY